MGAIYVQDDYVIDYTPSAAVAAGDVVVQGDLLGVAIRPIPANTLGSLTVEGIYDFPKATSAGSGIVSGTTVYWDSTNLVITATAQGNKLAGKTTRDAADGDATVRVRLHQ